MDSHLSLRGSQSHQLSGAYLLPFDATSSESHVEAVVLGIIVSTSHLKGG